MSRPKFYVGWDVGAWNCDRGGSRDALVVLDDKGELVGRSWRGNLREAINTSVSAKGFVATLFELCGTEFPDESEAILAVDTPLGFSTAFHDLIAKSQPTGQLIGPHAENPYLFRATERELYKRGVKPLSAVKDMIGSQATKGIHLVHKLFEPFELGVFRSGPIIAIEAYPAPSKKSAVIKSRLKSTEFPSGDEADAFVCALVAKVFRLERHLLFKPDRSIDIREGWIWLPADALSESRLAN